MTAPDSTELPALIRNAFDALPGPDEERLAALEPRLAGRLCRPPRRSRRLGWLFWFIFLAGGTAAAAWWSGGFRSQGDERISKEQSLSSPSGTFAAGEVDESDEQIGVMESGDAEPDDEQGSSLIYQRESF